MLQIIVNINFNPLVNCEPPLSEEELNMTVGEFIKKYNFTGTDHVLDSVMDTKMLNFLLELHKKKANNQNQLGVDLVVTFYLIVLCIMVKT